MWDGATPTDEKIFELEQKLEKAEDEIKLGEELAELGEVTERLTEAKVQLDSVSEAVKTKTNEKIGLESVIAHLIGEKTKADEAAINTQRLLKNLEEQAAAEMPAVVENAAKVLPFLNVLTQAVPDEDEKKTFFVKLDIV